MKPRNRFLLHALKQIRVRKLAKNPDMIPYDELEKEILSLPPEKMGPIFAHIHLLLGGNSVWFRHYKRLERKVCHRMKKREEELRSMQLIVRGDYVLLKSVGTEKNNYLTNEEKYIGK